MEPITEIWFVVIGQFASENEIALFKKLKRKSKWNQSSKELTRYYNWIERKKFVYYKIKFV